MNNNAGEILLHDSSVSTNFHVLWDHSVKEKFEIVFKFLTCLSISHSKTPSLSTDWISKLYNFQYFRYIPDELAHLLQVIQPICQLHIHIPFLTRRLQDQVMLTQLLMHNILNQVLQTKSVSTIFTPIRMQRKCDASSNCSVSLPN